MAHTQPATKVAWALAVAVLAQAAPAAAHDLPMGGSRWCFGKSAIVANIDLAPSLLAQIKGVKETGYPLEAMSDEQLSRLAADVLQPYVDDKLSIVQGGKKLRVKVTRVVSNGDLYTLWVSAEGATIDASRPITIDYRLLFEETGRAHVNLGYGYVSEATGEDLKRVFDFSQPAMQHTFDASAQRWEVQVARKPSPATRKAIRPPTVERAPAPRSEEPRKAAVVPPAPTSNESRGAPAELAQVVPAPPSAWASAGRFILLGVEHILTGYDHLAFLLAVVLVGLSLEQVLKTITAFTVAHSVTLLLAALDVVRLNARFVECAIAASICYVALENLYADRVRRRWLSTFGFGLIHGFGFASTLRGLIAEKSHLLVSVLSFNVGVELGQIMVFLAVLPVLHVAKARLGRSAVAVSASVAILLMGVTWLVERTFGLKLVPFLG